MEPVGMVMGFWLASRTGSPWAVWRTPVGEREKAPSRVYRMPLVVWMAKKPWPCEGEVERIAGGLDLTLAEIESVSAEDAEAVYGLAYLRGGFGILIDTSGEDAAEVVALGAEAGCSCVREVVGRSVERLCARQEACVCGVESTVHATGLCSWVAEVREVRVRRC